MRPRAVGSSRGPTGNRDNGRARGRDRGRLAGRAQRLVHFLGFDLLPPRSARRHRADPVGALGRGLENRFPVRRSAEAIAEAFRWSATRRVSKTASFSLQGNTYQVDPMLAGAHVELVYDPFDLTSPVAVAAAGSMPAEQAVLLEVRRHAHPKAAAARADTDAGAA